MPAIEFRNLARRNPVSALRAWRVEVEALGIDSRTTSAKTWTGAGPGSGL